MAFLIEEETVNMTSIDGGNFFSLIRPNEQLQDGMIDFCLKAIFKNEIKQGKVYVLSTRKVASLLKFNDPEKNPWYGEEIQDDERRKIFTTETLIMSILFINEDRPTKEDLIKEKVSNHFSLMIIGNKRRESIFCNPNLPRTARKINNKDANTLFDKYLELKNEFSDRQEKRGSWTLKIPKDYRTQGADNVSCGALILYYEYQYKNKKLHFDLLDNKNQPESYTDEEKVRIREELKDIVITNADRPEVNDTFIGLKKSLLPVRCVKELSIRIVISLKIIEKN